MMTQDQVTCPPSNAVGLERTRYFHRQLVGPEDLTQDQLYFREKSRRHNRMLHGWGIVCGLDVSCSGPDDARSCCGTEGGDGPFVYVKPGYAVDCCGNDLVVCEPLKVDLSSVCADEDDPCAPKKTTASTSTNTSTTTTRIGRIARHAKVVDDASALNVALGTPRSVRIGRAFLEAIVGRVGVDQDAGGTALFRRQRLETTIAVRDRIAHEHDLAPDVDAALREPVVVVRVPAAGVNEWRGDIARRRIRVIRDAGVTR
jgi:hypothetical protein